MNKFYLLLLMVISTSSVIAMQNEGSTQAQENEESQAQEADPFYDLAENHYYNTISPDNIDQQAIENTLYKANKNKGLDKIYIISCFDQLKSSLVKITKSTKKADTYNLAVNITEVELRTIDNYRNSSIFDLDARHHCENDFKKLKRQNLFNNVAFLGIGSALTFGLVWLYNNKYINLSQLSTIKLPFRS